MKHTQNSNLPPILVFGAHPDDIEFGCGGVVALETQSGRRAHFVVCSKGEAGTKGSADQRGGEAERAAEILGASIEFMELDGDAHLEVRVSHAIRLAEVIRRIRPSCVLAPTWVDNQHPDHARLGQLVRNAARLARYGGLSELKEHQTHAIEQLFYYAITPDGEPKDANTILLDVSSHEVISAWVAAMECHMSQFGARRYVDLQIARARVFGELAGTEHAIALYSQDPLTVQSLEAAGKGARHY